MVDQGHARGGGRGWLKLIANQVQFYRPWNSERSGGFGSSCGAPC